MTVLMKQLGWTKEESEDIVQEVRKELDDLGIYVYFRV